MKLSPKIEQGKGAWRHWKSKAGVHRWMKGLQHRSLRHWMKNPRNFDLKPKYNQYIGWEI